MLDSLLRPHFLLDQNKTAALLSKLGVYVSEGVWGGGFVCVSYSLCISIMLSDYTAPPPRPA